MRFNIWILLTLATAVVGKNVFNFDALKNLDGNSKRDAKNVYTLDSLAELLKDEQTQKRDAKYLVDIDELLAHLQAETNEKRDDSSTTWYATVEKREAKNIIDLDYFLVSIDANIEKREAKNLVTVDKLAEALAAEQKSKRDAKNVLNFDDFMFKLDSIKKRRFWDVDEEQQVLQDTQGASLLQSLLPQIPSVSIFAGYIRDNEKIAKMTETVGENMLIICPTDESISNNLHGLKPWEFPKPLTGGPEDEEIAQSNINFYLASHIVAKYEHELHSEGDDVVVSATLLSGAEIRIKQDAQGSIAVDSGNGWVPVEESRHVDNGNVFIINDTLIKP